VESFIAVHTPSIAFTDRSRVASCPAGSAVPSRIRVHRVSGPTLWQVVSRWRPTVSNRGPQHPT
jgi:hypothetical protein